MLDSTFSSKSVLITGGSTGIGEATARWFHKRGAKVTLADIQEENAHKLARELGDGVQVVACDVADPEQVAQAASTAEQNHGAIDILVCNAGIEAGGPLAECTPAIFARVYAVNVIGVFNCIKAVAPSMIAAGGGAIVSTASAAGFRGSAMMGPYSASKAALINLTQTAALEYRPHNIRVNCVCPGFIKTPMLNRIKEEMEAMFGSSFDDIAAIKQARFGRPEEIAEAIGYLASPAASFVSGIALPVDNALMAGML